MIVILESLELVKPGRREFCRVLSEKTNTYIFFTNMLKGIFELCVLCLVSKKKSFCKVDIF
jgi:hypothetical protein